MTIRPVVMVIALGALVTPGQVANDYLYMIREGSRAGFINRSGVVVVPPKYDAVGEPHENRIRVSVGGHAGYIDLSGKEVIELKYDTASEFQESRAVVMAGGKYSLIDPAGRLVAELPYRVLGNFHQGLLRLQATNLVDGNDKKLPTKYGFVDREGKVVIPPTLMPAGEFPDDPADLNTVGCDRAWCYIDRTGKTVIKVPFGEHLENPDVFANGRLRFKEGFTWGFKDATGAWAIPPKYNDARGFKDGLAEVQDGDKWIVIDVRGKAVPQDKKIRVIGPYSEGLAMATDNGLLGWVDQQGRLAFPMRKYQRAFKFSDGLARFELDGLYGYLDRSGNIAIMNKYDSAEDFDHGLARVRIRNGFGYIDTKGAVVWPKQ